MKASALLAECQVNGVEVYLIGDQIRAKGAGPALSRFAPLLREHKAELIEHLCAATEPVDAAGWIALIAELDRLIDRYCELNRVGSDAMGRIRAARNCQPLATIPASVEWFRRELANAN